jgi:glycosyltransferase involved in cell wall biosynthesis
MSEKIPLSVIVLTFNEEKNIRECLDSLVTWVDEVIIVDSFSTDATLSIIAEYPGVQVHQHEFHNYSLQRNWAFENLPIRNSFLMNLDADHRVTPELKKELISHFTVGVPPHIHGFMASRQTMFLGRWIKHGGHYPVYHGIIFRKGHGYCEHKEYDQHFVIQGEAIVLKGNVIDIITDSLTTFTARHNKWATLEAQDAIQLMKEVNPRTVKANKNGNPMEVRRYQRLKYYSYPKFWRVFLYFGYRYILKMGFRDGKEGLIFHFLQGFWFRFLVDAKIYEEEKGQ